jgi:hypothetical protein
VTFPRHFPSNVLQLHQRRWVILRVDSLVLWKIINEEDAILIPKNQGENVSSGFFTRNIFWGRCKTLCRHSTDCCLVFGHSDKTRFRPWSQIATENHLDRAKRKSSKSCSDECTVNVFDPRSGISGPTSRIASACPNLHEWWTQPAHVRCPVAQLLI